MLSANTVAQKPGGNVMPASFCGQALVAAGADCRCCSAARDESSARKNATVHRPIAANAAAVAGSRTPVRAKLRDPVPDVSKPCSMSYLSEKEFRATVFGLRSDGSTTLDS